LFGNNPTLALIALVIAVAAPLSGNQAFWTLPSALLVGNAAAGGIALVNSIGNLSGWIGPSVVGRLADVTGKTTTGLYVVAGLEVLAAALILIFIPRRTVAPIALPKNGNNIEVGDRGAFESLL